ncbi:MAG: phenylalanine--tRNA ligase subunit alpha, partial [Fervidicoccaceae archaeon]
MSEAPLSDSERRVLSALLSSGGSAWLDELSETSGLPPSTLASVVELLKLRGLVREELVIEEKVEVTRLGAEALERGLPEERLVELLSRTGGSLDAAEASRILGEEASVAIGEARRRGLVSLEGRELRLVEGAAERVFRLRAALISAARGERARDEEVLKELEERRLVKRVLRRRRRVVAEVSAARRALETTRPALTRLTSEDLVTGRWRAAELKAYNVEAEPPRLWPGEPHPMSEFVEYVRSVLFEMGFTEVAGPFVEQEFWNFDVLFQAQDHPSREIHDTFWLKHRVGKIIGSSRELVERVRAVHERGGSCGSTGWMVEWSEEIASRLVLRTQMTSSTIRALISGLEPPFRVFSIGKVFRPEKIDPKRLPEFHQLDGIIGEEGMSFSVLLGTLRELFERLGFERVKFRPAYFP